MECCLLYKSAFLNLPEVQPGDTQESLRGIRGVSSKVQISAIWLEFRQKSLDIIRDRISTYRMDRFIYRIQGLLVGFSVSNTFIIFPCLSSPQASCPLCNPIRWGPFLGGLIRELLCEWQCDQAGDGLDAGVAAWLLHQLAAAVAGRSATLCRKGLEGEPVLR